MRQLLYKYVGMFVLAAVSLCVLLVIFNPVAKSTHSIPPRQTSVLHDRIVPSSENKALRELQFRDLGVVKQYSAEYGIDYRLILAMIKEESQFDAEAQSERGASGFMQLMPVTDAEIGEILDLQDPRLPKDNIKAGIYYFSKLHDLFKDCIPDDRLRLALAAYNAGPSRVYDAQELAAYMGENPKQWSAIQNVLPLLSKRYYSLHYSVWGMGKPRSGYFGSWRQTLTYVDRTMNNYKEYKNLIN